LSHVFGICEFSAGTAATPRATKPVSVSSHRKPSTSAAQQPLAAADWPAMTLTMRVCTYFRTLGAVLRSVGRRDARDDPGPIPRSYWSRSRHARLGACLLKPVGSLGYEYEYARRSALRSNPTANRQSQSQLHRAALRPAPAPALTVSTAAPHAKTFFRRQDQDSHTRPAPAPGATDLPDAARCPSTHVLYPVTLDYR